MTQPWIGPLNGALSISMRSWVLACKMTPLDPSSRPGGNLKTGRQQYFAAPAPLIRALASTRSRSGMPSAFAPLLSGCISRTSAWTLSPQDDDLPSLQCLGS